MRSIDADSRVALEGSRPADSLTVWAWRDGALVVPEPLEVIDWSADDEAGDSVKVGQRWSFTIADPDGKLGAWRFDDPLSVAGTELQVIYRVGGAGAVNMGWFTVIANEPTVAVDSRVVSEYGYARPDSPVDPHARRVYTQTGVVKLEAVDRTHKVDQDRLQAPLSANTATVLLEIARLVQGHFPVIVDAGVTDVSITEKTVFDRERLEAVQDLAARVSARYRMGGDGELHVYPLRSAPVWRIEPDVALVSVGRKQSSDGLYNRWVVEGKGGDDKPVTASASITTGPLHYSGPFGKVPLFYSSEMITTEGQALAYAHQLRDEFLSSLSVELVAEITPRPELQAGDWVEVGTPFEDRVAYIPGQITSIKRSGTTVPGGTTLTVACAYADVTAALSRTEWAADITPGSLPPLTWDRVRASWGQLPPLLWNELA